MASHKDFIEVIDIRIREFLKSFIYVTEKEGRITQLANGDGKYTVIIDNVEYLISPINNMTYQVGDIVLIRLNNGNFNRKYILCKRPNW